jgi:hypothetical protein
VKISDQAPRDDPEIIDTVHWSSGLDEIFIQNLGNDSDLRYDLNLCIFVCVHHFQHLRIILANVFPQMAIFWLEQWSIPYVPRTGVANKLCRVL